MSDFLRDLKVRKQQQRSVKKGPVVAVIGYGFSREPPAVQRAFRRGLKKLGKALEE